MFISWWRPWSSEQRLQMNFWIFESMVNRIKQKWKGNRRGHLNSAGWFINSYWQWWLKIQFNKDPTSAQTNVTTGGLSRAQTTYETFYSRLQPARESIREMILRIQSLSWIQWLENRYIVTHCFRIRALNNNPNCVWNKRIKILKRRWRCGGRFLWPCLSDEMKRVMNPFLSALHKDKMSSGVCVMLISRCGSQSDSSIGEAFHRFNLTA